MSNSIAIKQTHHERLTHLWRLTTIALLAGTVFLLMSEPAFAATVVQNLQEPIKNLKKELFSWLIVIKIGAFVGGLAMAAFQFSIWPALTGVGVTAGIHLFDKYIGDGVTGALI